MAHQDYKDKHGNKLPSVTEVIGIIDKPFLNVWRAKLSTLKARGVLSACKLDAHDIITKLSASWLKENGLTKDEFWLDGEEISQQAREYGTTHHELLEKYIGGELNDTGAHPLLRLFDKYVKSEQYTIVETEQHLADENFGYHGTFDCLFKRGDEYTMVDFKFSKRINESFPVQLAAYAKIHAKKPHRGLILRFYETDAGLWKLQEKVYENLDTYFPVFEALLVVFKYFRGA